MALTMVASFLFLALTMVACVDDDGCISFGGYFFIHTADPLQANMHIGCMIVVKCDKCKILWVILGNVVGNVDNKHNMQVTHSQKFMDNMMPQT